MKFNRFTALLLIAAGLALAVCGGGGGAPGAERTGSARAETVVMQETIVPVTETVSVGTLKERTAYFNALAMNERFELLKSELIDGCYVLPPNEELKFLSDGSVLVFSFSELNSSGSEEMVKVHWMCDGRSISFYKEKGVNSPFPEKNNEQYESVRADYTSGFYGFELKNSTTGDTLYFYKGKSCQKF